MAKKKELTVEDKLRKLYDLQLIHSRIDRIHSLRGELPLEVQDLEDEISGLNRRLERLQSEIDAENAEITTKKNIIKDAELLIKRYEEQQMNVRNNREYDALSKEIEFQKLEIELAEKRIREYSLNIEHKTETLNGVNEQLEERNKHLEHKKGELDKILKETEKEEAQLQKAADQVSSEIEERLLNAYHRIRNNAKNGLAVVTIERHAIGGSFFTIPPQQQMEIAERKNILTTEHCGRILVDPELASEEEERMNKEFGELA